MKAHGFGPALACAGLAGALLFSAAFAGSVDPGASRPDRPLSAHPRAAAAFPKGSPAEGDLIATMSVPRLAMDSPVFEGVSFSTLTRGAGHVTSTALPGEEEGASFIAVPRGRWSDAVSKLKLNDRVRFQTSRGVFGYRVVERKVLEAARFDAVSQGRPVLTLVTTYPADFAGPAPMRLAVSLEPMGQ